MTTVGCRVTTQERFVADDKGVRRRILKIIKNIHLTIDSDFYMQLY
jgi:hypothetical protein